MCGSPRLALSAVLSGAAAAAGEDGLCIVTSEEDLARSCLKNSGSTTGTGRRLPMSGVSVDIDVTELAASLSPLPMRFPNPAEEDCAAKTSAHVEGMLPMKLRTLPML